MTRQETRSQRRQPGDREALLAAAMDAHRSGALDRAERLYARLLAAEPGAAPALRLAGVLARERGELGLSLRRLRAAADAAPGDARPLAELGLSLLAAGELEAAEDALRAALALDGGEQRARANLGALLQYRGHVDAAIECYRQSLADGGPDPELACNLAMTLADADRADDALALLDEYLDREPGQPLLLAARGAVLVGSGRWAESLAALEAATRRNPADDHALVNLANARRALGDRSGAEAALRAALRVNPAHARAAADLVNLLAAQAPAAGVALGRAFLARHPGTGPVLASLALALRDAGDDEAADALSGPDRWLWTTELEAPAGWPDLAAFLAALRERVLGERSLRPAPPSKATRDGLQTGELRLDAEPLLAALRAQLLGAVDACIAAWRAAGLDSRVAPLPGREPRLLRAWATVLGPGGRQAPHHHPLARVSGVLYLDLPPAMAGPGGTQGCLEFGLPPDRLAWRRRPPTRLVAPRPGRLVLFPSQLFHRTLPFSASGQRISIAFDVETLGAEIS